MALAQVLGRTGSTQGATVARTDSGQPPSGVLNATPGWAATRCHTRGRTLGNIVLGHESLPLPIPDTWKTI